MFKAEVIASSRNTFGNRITTMLVTYPRFIHSEMCRHRMLSRNTASSRAIPFKKMVEMVQNNPVVPLKWMKDHKGMQGTEYLDQDGKFWCDSTWQVARDYAVKQATILNERYGATKQLANRLLEPFMWTTELITGTEWENFFKLRVDPAAEIHMQYIADLMLTAYNEATVRQLEPGEWHIPYNNKLYIYESDKNSNSEIYLMDRIKISTALAAGISYTLLDDSGKTMDYLKLLKRHDTLVEGNHWSPFEHCAQSMTEVTHNKYGKFEGHEGFYHENHEYGWCRNFRGFIPYRTMFENENQKDSRVKH